MDSHAPQEALRLVSLPDQKSTSRNPDSLSCQCSNRRAIYKHQRLLLKEVFPRAVNHTTIAALRCLLRWRSHSHILPCRSQSQRCPCSKTTLLPICSRCSIVLANNSPSRINCLSTGRSQRNQSNRTRTPLLMRILSSSTSRRTRP